MSWMKITLTHDEITKGAEGWLHAQFKTVWEGAGAPKGAVMYGNFNTAFEGHHLFFSPGAVAIRS